MASYSSDEALARALHEEYELDFRRSQQQSRTIAPSPRLPPPAQNPSFEANEESIELSDEEIALRLSVEEQKRIDRTKSNRSLDARALQSQALDIEETDKELALRLALQEEKRAYNRAKSQRSLNGRSTHSQTQVGNETRHSNSLTTHSRTDEARSSHSRRPSDSYRQSDSRRSMNASSTSLRQEAFNNRSSNSQEAQESYRRSDSRRSLNGSTDPFAVETFDKSRGESNKRSDSRGRGMNDSSHSRSRDVARSSSRAQDYSRSDSRRGSMNGSSHSRRAKESYSRSDSRGKGLNASSHSRGGQEAPTGSDTRRNSMNASSHSRAAPESYARSDSRRNSMNASSQSRKHGSNSSTPVTSLSDGSVYYDEEIARRVEQELSDEELAKYLAAQEEERISRQQAREVAAQSTQKKCTWKRACRYIIPLFVIFGAAAGLIYYFAFNDGDGLPFWNPEDFGNEDPFNEVNPDDASRWRNDGRGVELEVLNALDNEWYTFFYRAIAEWDDPSMISPGAPDALTLSTSVRSAEPECSPVRGKLKICNGNYGDTGWRGINEILLQNGYIIASTAKMNEYYFSRSDDSQRQYTMCHEAGHGWGLPHTDENFYNEDLGNCMDYTSNPAANMQPGRQNYEFLSKLYGNVTQAVSSSENVADGGKERGKDRGKRRRAVQTPDEPLSEWLAAAWDDFITDIEQRVDGREHENGWRLLHRHRKGEAHELDLGEGYTLQVHKLLVPDNETD